MLAYTFWHQLFVYSCISCLLSAHLFSYPSVICLWCYLVIFCLQFILLLFYAHYLYARALLFIHTLTRSLSDDLGFVRPDIGRFVSIIQVLDETIYIARSWSLSLPNLVFSSLLPSCYFLILDISDSVVILVLYLYDIMHGCLYVILQ